MLISVEIPNPELDPLVYDIVKTTKIRGSFGNLNRNSPFMLNGSYSKRYPRPLSKDTHTTDDGYSQYRGKVPSDSGFSFETNGVKIDN